MRLLGRGFGLEEQVPCPVRGARLSGRMWMRRKRERERRGQTQGWERERWGWDSDRGMSPVVYEEDERLRITTRLLRRSVRVEIRAV